MGESCTLHVLRERQEGLVYTRRGTRTMTVQIYDELIKYNDLAHTYINGPVLRWLARFLEVMPKIFGDDWWEKNVLANLTEPQLKELRRTKASNLGGLDLATLLVVLDKN